MRFLRLFGVRAWLDSIDEAGSQPTPDPPSSFLTSLTVSTQTRPPAHVSADDTLEVRALQRVSPTPALTIQSNSSRSVIHHRAVSGELGPDPLLSSGCGSPFQSLSEPAGASSAMSMNQWSVQRR